jgi:hypothetical protein
MLPEMDARIQAAAEEIEKVMLGLHQDAKGIHVNTLISTAAAITGEAILRAVTDADSLYRDRGAIFSLGAEDVLFGSREGSVMSYIGFTAVEAGLPADSMPDIYKIMQHTSNKMGNAGPTDIPALTVPMDQRPHFWALGGATHARPQLVAIYAKHRLEPLEAVLANTLLLCRFLHGTRGVLKPEFAFRLAMETLAGAIRMHPISAEDLELMAGSQQ